VEINIDFESDNNSKERLTDAIEKTNLYMTMLKVTFDSCLVNLKGDQEIDLLEKFHKEAKIKIVVAQRFIKEMSKYNPSATEKASNYACISEPFTVGLSGIGSAYIISESVKSRMPSVFQLNEILFPGKDFDKLNENQKNDLMHLIGHAASDSEYFITRNTKDFIENRALKNRKGIDWRNFKRNQLEVLKIKVLSPTEFILLLKDRKVI
jgi:hypothetical protein